jgi:hypothetical protein
LRRRKKCCDSLLLFLGSLPHKTQGMQKIDASKTNKDIKYDICPLYVIKTL